MPYIIVRGIERRQIFREDEDRVNFKTVVERVAELFGIEQKDVLWPEMTFYEVMKLM